MQHTSENKVNILSTTGLHEVRANVWQWMVNICCLVIVLLCVEKNCLAQVPVQSDLTAKDLNELMNIEVTSASRKEEKLFEIPAAVYVITQEDIRRSGLTSIPEILRMVPGLNVARINESTWAISTRGFNHRFANKMLVLIDGRSVYTPLFSGVFWNAQDVVLEDVERIEVIRGPGGTLWGANAVNGIINIITKRARDTQGGLLSTLTGAQERGVMTARYGGKIGSKLYYRGYIKAFERLLPVSHEEDAHNDHEESRQHNHNWKMARSGFRLDWEKSGQENFSLIGDLYRGSETPKQPYDPQYSRDEIEVGARDRSSGGNLQARWSKVFSANSDINAQAYYDRTFNDNLVLDELRDTLNFDLQHHFKISHRHDLIWGGGYRYSDGRSLGDGTADLIALNLSRNSFKLFSLFAQDKVGLVKEKVSLVLGAKLEHYDFAGWQIQPSARLLWEPNARNSVWGAVSRAVRVPSRVEQDSIRVLEEFSTAEGLNAVVRLQGSKDFRSEVVIAAEMGYRFQANNRLYFDLTAFRNAYHHQKSYEPGTPFLEQTLAQPRLVIPIYYQNLMRANAFGVEVSVNAQLSANWKMNGSYSQLETRFWRTPTSLDVNVERIDRSSPRHQFQVRSMLNLPRRFELDSAVYFVGTLIGQEVPRYTRCDLNLGWRMNEKVSFNIVGQNLLKAQHLEFGSFGQGIKSQAMRRTVYGKVTWNF